MAFVQNLPFISIILSLFAGPLSSILSGKKAKWVNLAVITIIGCMSAAVLGFVMQSGKPYVYMMGHFPAPWGNEIRVGLLEAAMAMDGKIPREELVSLLDLVEAELARRAVQGGGRRRLLRASGLVRELNAAARLNVNGGQLAGWLCAGMFQSNL